MLPKENFPPRKTVYNNFRIWKISGVWKKTHDALVKKVRKAKGKKASPSALIIDSQTVKSAASVCKAIGYDAGKKMKGRKRHIVVDTLGLMHAVKIHSADIQDQDGAKQVLKKLKGFKHLKVIFADSAYKRNGLPAWTKAKLGVLLQAVLRPAEVKGFVVLPKRWIVERTFSWLIRYRRNSKDYEKLPDSAEAMVYIAMIQNMLKTLQNKHCRV